MTHYVKTLIGRNAGEILEMPTHAAQAALSNGTAVKPTDAELAEWLDNRRIIPIYQETVTSMVPGYRTAIRDDREGYDLFEVDGTDPLNDTPIPNLAAARDFAEKHSAANAGDPVVIPDDWEALGLAERRALASKLVDVKGKKNTEIESILRAAYEAQKGA